MLKWRSCGLLVISLSMVSSALWAEEPGETPEPKKEQAAAAQTEQKPLPGFQNVRFEENWSSLKNTVREGYRAFKFVPLNDSESAYLSVGGQLRMRGEGWSGFDFGGPGKRDDFFGLFRLRLHSDFHFGQNVRVFVEAKSAIAVDRDLPGGRRTLDVDTIDLQNAVLDLRIPAGSGAVTFRLGRQELQFGRQRLVSPLDWSNTRRTFDGARAIAQSGTWRIDGFWSKFAPVKKYSFNTSDGSGWDLYGVYASGRPARQTTLDLYWLGLQNDLATWQGKKGTENRQTVGARWGRTQPEQGPEFELEGAFQFGDQANRDIRAFMTTAEAGIRFKAKFKPRVYTAFDYASGDDDPLDDEIGTFNHLFPLGHAYLGYIDVVGRQNVIDWSQGFSIAPAGKLQTELTAHWFWRANTSDALYNAGGAVVRAGDAGDARFVGTELDLTAAYPINRFWLINGGYSHFFPGGFIDESGTSEAIDFVYFALQVTF